ncbi:MAG: hypothetical protein KDB79_10490 [Acidobacteria bacterium]|nr:hypothetical protein [Acidobacteriota bacterium]
MGILNFLRRSKPDNSQEARRRNLLQNGRITDAVIIDTEINDAGEEIAHLVYSVQGVDFESSEILTEEQRMDQLKYAPGASVTVRYDPRNHGNSILV